MAGHDVFVLGSSAGGIKALTSIVKELPAGLGAAIFIVQHLSPEHISLLPQILADTTALRVVQPHDREEIRKGVIYVAPPDHHMLVNRTAIRVVRGPRENRFRPAIDALFRSAARAHGPRVVGVVLSGLLDDGTVGLQAIKKQGGIAVVQDPNEAEFPPMPTSALRYVKVDHCLTLAEISAFLVQAARMPAVSGAEVSKEIEIESKVAEQQMDAEQLLESVEAIGTRTVFTCPACNGSLWQIGDEEPLRFRCHVGHAFTADTLLAEQTRSLENALWSAIRLMEEKAAFARRIAKRRRKAHLLEEAAVHEQYADSLDREVATIRQLVLDGAVTRYLLPDEKP